MDLVCDHLGCFWEGNLFWPCLSLWFKKWISFKGQFRSQFQIMRPKVINYLLGFLFQRLRGHKKRKNQGFPSMDFSFVVPQQKIHHIKEADKRAAELSLFVIWSQRKATLLLSFGLIFRFRFIIHRCHLMLVCRRSQRL